MLQDLIIKAAPDSQPIDKQLELAITASPEVFLVHFKALFQSHFKALRQVLIQKTDKYHDIFEKVLRNNILLKFFTLFAESIQGQKLLLEFLLAEVSETNRSKFKQCRFNSYPKHDAEKNIIQAIIDCDEIIPIYKKNILFNLLKISTDGLLFLTGYHWPIHFLFSEETEDHAYFLRLPIGDVDTIGMQFLRTSNDEMANRHFNLMLNKSPAAAQNYLKAIIETPPSLHIYLRAWKQRFKLMLSPSQAARIEQLGLWGTMKNDCLRPCQLANYRYHNASLIHVLAYEGEQRFLAKVLTHLKQKLSRQDFRDVIMAKGGVIPVRTPYEYTSNKHVKVLLHQYQSDYQANPFERAIARISDIIALPGNQLPTPTL